LTSSNSYPFTTSNTSVLFFFLSPWIFSDSMNFPSSNYFLIASVRYVLYFAILLPILCCKIGFLSIKWLNLNLERNYFDSNSLIIYYIYLEYSNGLKKTVIIRVSVSKKPKGLYWATMSMCYFRDKSPIGFVKTIFSTYLSETLKQFLCIYGSFFPSTISSAYLLM
jgi:hypothetical protein